MILREFSSNQPSVMIGIPLVVAGIIAPMGFMGLLPSPGDDFPVDRWLLSYGNTWVNVAFTAVCLVTGAFLCNRVFNKHEFHDSPTFIPALLYTMAGLCFFVLGYSSSVLLAHIFLLLGLDQLLFVFRQGRVLSQYFQAGLWFGLAALVYPPYVILLPALWAAIISTRAFHWREHLLPLIGFGIPFLYWIVWKYWSDDTAGLVLFYREWPVAPGQPWFQGIWSGRIMYLLVVLSILFGLPRYLFLSGRSSNKSKTVKKVFFIIAVALVLSIALGRAWEGTWNAGGILLPLSFIAGFWYTNYRYSLIAPFMFYGLLVFQVLVCLDRFRLM